MADDNKRAAAGMKVTLSGSVIAGAFAVFGGVAAITTFTILNKESLGWFYFWVSLSALSLLVSMVAGAKGISEVFLAGYADSWDRDEGKEYFSTQAAFGILGLVFAVASVFAGQIKAPTEPDWAKALERRMDGLEQRVAATEKSQVQPKAAETEPKAKTGKKKAGRR